MPPNLLPYNAQDVPLYQSGGTVVTPADDSFEDSLSPQDGLNPYLYPDGFSYLVSLKFLAYRGFPMQLRLLNQYRQEALQGKWVPRWYTVPLDSSVPLNAGDTLNFEVHTVKQGSVLWGMSFAMTTGTPSMIRVRITDVATGQLLMTQQEIASAMQANLTNGNTPKAGFPFVLLMHPHVISGQGDLLVDLVNSDTVNNHTVQLLLMCLEPVD